MPDSHRVGTCDFSALHSALSPITYIATHITLCGMERKENQTVPLQRKASFPDLKTTAGAIAPVPWFFSALRHDVIHIPSHLPFPQPLAVSWPQCLFTGDGSIALPPVSWLMGWFWMRSRTSWKLASKVFLFPSIIPRELCCHTCPGQQSP